MNDKQAKLRRAETKMVIGASIFLFALFGAVLALYSEVYSRASTIPAPGIQTISDGEMARIVNLEATLANLRCGEVRMLPLPDGVILANGEVRLQTICFRLGNLETDQTLHLVIERQVLVTYDYGDKVGTTFVVFTAKGTNAWLEIAPEGTVRGELNAAQVLEETGLAASLDEYTRKTKTIEFDLDRSTGAISNVVLTDGAE